MLGYGGQSFSAIRAAYWSPDSRRLLLYTFTPGTIGRTLLAGPVLRTLYCCSACPRLALQIASCAVLLAYSLSASWRGCITGSPTGRCWVVWERHGSQSCFSRGPVHIGSTAYEDTHLPFFDSYAQARQIIAVCDCASPALA